MASIDLVVVNYKTYGTLQKLIDSYHKFRPVKTECNLILVDNDADFSQMSHLASRSAEVLALHENVGYGRACNIGADWGSSDYIGLLNADIQFINNTAIDMTVDFLENNPDVAIAGPIQFSSEGKGRRVTHAGIGGDWLAPEIRSWKKRETPDVRVNERVPMVSGSAMFVRRSDWDLFASDPHFRKLWPNAVGAMPESLLYHEDTTLCALANRYGKEVWYLGEPGYEMVHLWHDSISRVGENSQAYRESRASLISLLNSWGESG